MINEVLCVFYFVFELYPYFYTNFDLYPSTAHELSTATVHNEFRNKYNQILT